MTSIGKIRKTDKYKYPYEIICGNGRRIPVPKQQRFKTAFIRDHGCSLVGMYIALRWCGKKWTMGKCLKYAKKNLKCKSKFPIVEIARALKKVIGTEIVKFRRTTTAEQLGDWLRKGWLVIFEEGDPIHTVCLVWDGARIRRISSGKISAVTATQEIKRKCGNKVYRGVILIKKNNA